MTDKIAILYTGEERSFCVTRHSHLQLYDEADIFVSTWDTEDQQQLKQWIPNNKILGWTTHKRDVIQNSIRKLAETTTNEENPYINDIFKCMSQYFLVEQAYQLMKSSLQNYKAVVRLRFDMFLIEGSISPQKIINDSVEENVLFGLLDRFNYGSPVAMEGLCKIFSNCTDWYLGINRPCFESLLIHHLQQNNITQKNNYGDFFLIRGGRNQGIDIQEKYLNAEFSTGGYIHKNAKE